MAIKSGPRRLCAAGFMSAYGLRNNSGNFAMFAAIRRASSLVRSLAADRIVEMYVGELWPLLLPAGIGRFLSPRLRAARKKAGSKPLPASCRRKLASTRKALRQSPIIVRLVTDSVNPFRQQIYKSLVSVALKPQTAKPSAMSLNRRLCLVPHTRHSASCGLSNWGLGFPVRLGKHTHQIGRAL
jgi:hypothetical protein